MHLGGIPSVQFLIDYVLFVSFSTALERLTYPGRVDPRKPTRHAETSFAGSAAGGLNVQPCPEKSILLQSKAQKNSALSTSQRKKVRKNGFQHPRTGIDEHEQVRCACPNAPSGFLQDFRGKGRISPRKVLGELNGKTHVESPWTS